jgi:tripartite-type tricarboxylate transporter receptor subunit TctC
MGGMLLAPFWRSFPARGFNMRRGLIIGLTLVLAACGSALAESYPSKPIRAIIPFGAGSATDVIPRIVFDQLSIQLGQAIIVENRGGAGGTIGSAAVAKADPDGYTILVNSSAHTITPAIYPNLTYDVANDFVAIGAIGSVPNVLIISPEKGIKTIKDFVAAAKAKPGTFNFASVGIGSAVHLSAERFRISAGYEAQHIPFKGGAEALTEVIAGRVEYYFCPIATALPHIREGKLLGLAVSSPKRASALPDVPTTLESGFPDSDYTFWIGIFAPAKTPKEIVDKLNAEMAKAVQAPAVREKLATLGVELMPMTPSEFDAHVKGEIARYASFAKAAGLKPN